MKFFSKKSKLLNNLKWYSEPVEVVVMALLQINLTDLIQLSEK